jgi:hypothetical protein
VGQIAEEDVKRDGWTGVPEVGITIDGRPTDIETYVWSLYWLEDLLASVECIIDG